MSRQLGLIIGINDYQDTAFQHLHYAENDARALAQWLVNVKGGAWSPGDVQLVLGAHATKELIESLITQMCLTMAEPDDLVFIYFAGHSFLDESNGNSYLALANTHHSASATALHLLSFTTQVMTRCRAAHMLIMLDSFQNGPLWQMRRSTPYDAKPLLDPTMLNVLMQQGNRIFLCSCRGNEQAPEAGEHSLGLLMHRMIVGLSGPTREPATGQTTLQSLYGYLQQSLGDQQRPQPFGQERTPLILVGGQTPTPPPQPPPQGPATSNPPSGTFGTSGLPRSGLFQRPQGLTSANPPSGTFGTSGLPRSGLFQQPQGAQAATLQASPPPSTPLAPEQPSAPSPEQQRQSQHLLGQAQQLIQTQQYTEAITLIDQALLITPQEMSALTLKSQILGTLGRFQEALAVVDQLLQLNPYNPLAWSMRAVLIMNKGEYQEALAAIERSLALDANNSETLAIKNNITEKIGPIPIKSGTLNRPHASPPEPPSINQAQAFLIGSMLQIVGFFLGIAGILLPALVPQIPTLVGAILTGLGTALLFVPATRNPYRYGWAHILPTFLVSIIAASVIVFGGLLNLVITAHTPTNNLLLTALKDRPTLIVPLFVLGSWLLATTVVPPLLALGGLLTGSIVKARRKK